MFLKNINTEGHTYELGEHTVSIIGINEPK